MATGTFLDGFFVSPARKEACCHPPYENRTPTSATPKPDKLLFPDKDKLEALNEISLLP